MLVEESLCFQNVALLEQFRVFALEERRSDLGSEQVANLVAGDGGEEQDEEHDW